MIHLVFKILKNEGVLINVFLFFFLFSPVYLLDMFLVIPIALLLLHREILNQAAPSEQILTLYKVFGCPHQTMLCSNALVILAVNVINGILLVLLNLYVGESIQFYDYLMQVILLNGVLIFSAAFSNVVLHYRLSRKAYNTGHRVIIISLFVLSVLMVFITLFFLVRDRLVIGYGLFLLILLIWVLSVYKRND